MTQFKEQITVDLYGISFRKSVEKGMSRRPEKWSFEPYPTNFVCEIEAHFGTFNCSDSRYCELLYVIHQHLWELIKNCRIEFLAPSSSRSSSWISDPEMNSKGNHSAWNWFSVQDCLDTVQMNIILGRLHLFLTVFQKKKSIHIDRFFLLKLWA